VRYRELAIAGVFVVEIEPICDQRGFFSRTVCSEDFAKHGLPANYSQSSISFNKVRGTLRGMHFQVAPSRENKLVRCTQGAVYDVVLDLREGSKTFGRSIAQELSAENRLALAIPDGCAHGFMTLLDNSELLYMMTENHNPDLARGVRWNDPRFGISWPMEPVVISERDRGYGDFGIL
jgi:dTDP-4-dehydrorhamnose 3,5-epimerase